MYYNNPGHSSKICWKIHGKPANWKISKMGDKSKYGFPSANEADTCPSNEEQIDYLLKLLKSNSHLVFLVILMPYIIV